jgi:uncharacterized SAM-binding protein YcdF (DUF218 family)
MNWLSKHRWKFLGGGLALLSLYFCLPVFLTAIARQLQRDDGAHMRLPENGVDLIVALGGSLRCERELYAADLFKQGWGAYLSVSGVPMGDYGHTADSLRRSVIAANIPPERVVMVRDQFNTRTEARRTVELMRQRGWRRAIIVTSAFHSRRAVYTFERAAPELQFFSFPVPQTDREWRAERWWSRRRDALMTVREFISWLNTGLRGWE